MLMSGHTKAKGKKRKERRKRGKEGWSEKGKEGEAT